MNDWEIIEEAEYNDDMNRFNPNYMQNIIQNIAFQ